MCPKAAEMSAITGIISMWSHFSKINLQILSAVIISKAGTLKQYPTCFIPTIEMKKIVFLDLALLVLLLFPLTSGWARNNVIFFFFLDA